MCRGAKFGCTDYWAYDHGNWRGGDSAPGVSACDDIGAAVGKAEVSGGSGIGIWDYVDSWTDLRRISNRG